MEQFRFIYSESKCFLKIVVIMSKKTKTVIVEILKAVIYALSGFFGGNVLM